MSDGGLINSVDVACWQICQAAPVNAISGVLAMTHCCPCLGPPLASLKLLVYQHQSTTSTYKDEAAAQAGSRDVVLQWPQLQRPGLMFS